MADTPRIPTMEECIAESGEALARLFDEVYGEGRWTVEPEETADAA